MQSEKNGKTALVVGGGTGMGYATAVRLAGRGVSLVISGRREDVLVDAQRRMKDVHADAAVEILLGTLGSRSKPKRWSRP